jgi:hypothetical protein
MKLRGKAIRPSHFFDSILIQISIIKNLNDVFQEAGEQTKIEFLDEKFITTFDVKVWKCFWDLLGRYPMRIDIKFCELSEIDRQHGRNIES